MNFGLLISVEIVLHFIDKKTGSQVLPAYNFARKVVPFHGGMSVLYVIQILTTEQVHEK